MPRPLVHVLSLGGTIASPSPAPGGGRGVVPSLDAADLVDAAGSLAEVADVVARPLGRLPGPHVGLGEMLRAAAAVRAALDEGAHGVVVTQGTDTIEDTAYALELLVGGEAPVVVTGALRHPGLPGADGPANLAAAVAVAAEPVAAGLGATVVMGDEVHAARFVAKAHTTSPAAFVSYPGPIGWVSEGSVVIVTRPAGRPPVLTPRPGAAHRVGLVSLGPGDDAAGAQGWLAAGVEGLVVEALGGGHIPPAALEVLAQAAARMPVVVASTARRGQVLRDTYGFAGSETDLAARGFIGAGWLPARKARLLLTLLLRAGAGADAVADTFARPYR